MPAPWKNSECQPAFFAAVASEPSTLMLDYDGTLAPFSRDRLRAQPYDGVIARLEKLASLSAVRLVLVTGRPAIELKHLLKLSRPVEIWGSHGRENLTPEGSYYLFELSPEQQRAIDEIELALREKGFSAAVERKPVSLAAHWRSFSSADQASIKEAIETIHMQRAQATGLNLLAFDGGLEIRSDAETKGTVVQHVLSPSSSSPAAYLGDDTTDEDAFLALRGRGLTILVRQESRPSAAEYWIRPPDELLSFLDAWATAAERLAA